MSEAQQTQTFLGEPTSSPDGTSPESELDSRDVHTSMVFAIEDLLCRQGPQLTDTEFIFDLPENRITTSISVKSHSPVDGTPLFTILDDGTPTRIPLKPFLVRNRNDDCGHEYDHDFPDSTGKPHLSSERQNEMWGGSSCFGLIGSPYIDARMIVSDEKPQIRMTFDLEIENLSKTDNFADTIKGYKGLRREIYVEIHDSIRGLPQISLVSLPPTLFENPEDIGRTSVWISYNTQLSDSVIAECSHVAFDVNYMCCMGTSTFPIPNGIICPEDENFPIPRDPRDK
jgi:hypothetical protein